MPIPFVIAAVLAGAAPDPLAAPVVAAENQFAADARRLGTRLAFLAHFDAGSWLLRGNSNHARRRGATPR